MTYDRDEAALIDLAVLGTSSDKVGVVGWDSLSWWRILVKAETTQDEDTYEPRSWGLQHRGYRRHSRVVFRWRKGWRFVASAQLFAQQLGVQLRRWWERWWRWLRIAFWLIVWKSWFGCVLEVLFAWDAVKMLMCLMMNWSEIMACEDVYLYTFEEDICCTVDRYLSLLWWDRHAELVVDAVDHELVSFAKPAMAFAIVIWLGLWPIVRVVWASQPYS